MKDLDGINANFDTEFYSISLYREVNTYIDNYGLIRFESLPIEKIRFNSIEDAKEFANKEGLKEDEYEIITWGI